MKIAEAKEIWREHFRLSTEQCSRLEKLCENLARTRGADIAFPTTSAEDVMEKAADEITDVIRDCIEGDIRYTIGLIVRGEG